MIGKEIFISSILTLFLFVYDIFHHARKIVAWYVFFFGLIYFLLFGLRCHAFEEMGVIDLGDGVIFESFQDFEGEARPTREFLIQKMIEHRKGHDLAMRDSELVLKNFNLWNADLEELYVAAFAAVSTYAGCRNFMLPAVIAILQYISQKGWTGMQVWKSYSTHYYKGQYHAEMFDFYMAALKRYYHQ